MQAQAYSRKKARIGGDLRLEKTAQCRHEMSLNSISIFNTSLVAKNHPSFSPPPAFTG